MSLTIELVLIRYCQTDANIRRLCSDVRYDEPLNQTDREQAHELAKQIAAQPIEFVVSSDLLRVRKTAESINPARKIACHFYPCLRGADVGSLDNMAQQEIRERHGELWNSANGHLTFDLCPFGGEDFGHVVSRHKECLGELCASMEALTVTSA